MNKCRVKSIFFCILIVFLLNSRLISAKSNQNRVRNGRVLILEKRCLSFKNRGDIPFEGVSDLAYNRKNGILYMIGDRGYLYKFYAQFSSKKIVKLRYIDGFHIKTFKGKIIHPDIEGLTLTPKKELIASFEGSPRVRKITASGRIKLNYKIPRKLRRRAVYKSRNGMLESVTYHSKYGILIAVEYPIKGSKKYQTIYSLRGKEWHFKAEKYKNSAVTAIEVMDDGNILVLERAYSGILNPMIITLKKVYLNRCNKKAICKSEVLATFNSNKGWGYDNFEGLAKVGKNRYIMVSDNNGYPFLPTVFLYFKILPKIR